MDRCLHNIPVKTDAPVHLPLTVLDADVGRRLGSGALGQRMLLIYLQLIIQIKILADGVADCVQTPVSGSDRHICPLGCLNRHRSPYPPDLLKVSLPDRKMILIQEEGKDPSCLPYAIDRKSDDLTLAQITESAIDFLTKGKNKGFFLMVEGGKIDWACHANDAATVFNEVKDMDDAIKVAYEFYKKHPKETLIVVTADHETGGIVLGTGRYELNLKALQYQKHSADGLSKQISELRKSKGNKVTWEDMKEFLGNEMGFWKQFPISWEQEKKLRDEFEQSFVRNKVVFAESMYSKSEPMAARAKEVMDQISMVGWVSGGHSAGYVPVFAIGAGSQLFGEKIDNTEIPKRIAKAAGYK